MRLMRACGYGECRILPIEHAGQAEVVGVLAGAGGLAGGVDHGGGFADDGEVVGRSSLVVGHYRFLASLGMTKLK